MTPNERQVLVKFHEMKQGNAVTIAEWLRVTIHYASDLCRKLCEKRYLERLSPARVPSYRITPLGEEQVRAEGEAQEAATERREEVPQPAVSAGEYECTNCGAAVNEADPQCPKCGVVFEGDEEEPEEEMSERAASPPGESPPPEERSEEALQPISQPPEVARQA